MTTAGSKRSLPSSSVENFHEKVIHLAYAMASDSAHYVELILVVMERVEALHQAKTNPRKNANLHFPHYDQLCWHMSNALNLLEQKGRYVDVHKSPMQQIDEDAQPAFLVNAQFRVIHTNQPAQERFGIGQGQSFNAAHCEIGDFDVLAQSLSAITLGTDGDLPKLVHIHPADSATTDPLSEPMLLTRATLPSGEGVARLTAVSAVWNESVGRSFQRAFKLTNVEFEIVRAIALGKDMIELAKERQRAVTTVRQQLKNLLKKLALPTQRDLVRLYAGYLHLREQHETTTAQSTVAMQEIDHAPEVASLSRLGNRQLQYYSFGPANGRPVINVHTIIGGLSFTPEVIKQLHQRNIRLICPWRPGFAGTSPSSAVAAAGSAVQASLVEEIDTDLEDILAIMDSLNIHSVPVLAHSNATLVACALARKYPDRVKGIVAAAGNVPFVTDAQLDDMPMSIRSITLLARYVPELVPFFCRARIAFDDNASAKQQFGDLLDLSPADSSLVYDPYVSRLLERSRRDITRQGAMAYAREVQMTSQDWSNYLPEPSMPLVYVQGSEDVLHSPARVREFLAGRRVWQLIEVAGSGRLMFLHNPAAVLDALDGFL